MSRRTKRGGTHNNRNRNQDNNFNPVAFMNNVNILNPDNPAFYINMVRENIMKLNKQSTKTLFLHLCTYINEHNHQYDYYSSNQYSTYLPYLVTDITFFKLKAMHNYKENIKPRHFIVIDFNKFMDNE